MPLTSTQAGGHGSSLAARLAGRALDIVFPPRCVSCREFGAFMCERCRASMTRAAEPRCALCWMLGPARECSRCRYRRPAFKAARAVFVYEGAARDAVHALKFRGVSAVARDMAGSMAEAVVRWEPPVTAIVPVPLAGLRRRLRGYNQSDLLARDIARLTGLPVRRNALIKRYTPPQTQQADEEARRRNMEGAFRPGRPAITGGVLLVDDVMTTGATLEACARVLLGAGGGPVYALTFARED